MQDIELYQQQQMQPSETASSAVAAQAMASVQARYAIAYRKPRLLDQVRADLLKECSRTAFAEVAQYYKPIGKGIRGPSIRFAETAARCMGNILVESPTVYDDSMKRIVRVMATDLETNMTYQKDVTIVKTVERRALRQGQAALSTRTNSFGQTLYIVEADDDAILNKENALVSKAMRNVLLRIIPGDIVSEALEVAQKTLSSKIASDPEKERHNLIDAFASVGVEPTDLVGYLRHDISKITQKELEHLRTVYASIRDGEASWNDVVGETETETNNEERTKTSRVHDELKKRKNNSKEAEPQKQTEQSNTAPSEALENALSSIRISNTWSELNSICPQINKLSKKEKEIARVAYSAKRIALDSEELEPGSNG